ncbi:hypothetical protein [Marinobacter fonticola]|uniref:hypothetical protein n=1 Tax=Marinobacter fonticola TaxID=2603215 RepID=UPI0011E66F81|nr:hypothetical protein [Marinobacter fonticola]
MLLFDLRQPMTDCRVHDTEEHPLVELRALADRALAVMMSYSLDYARVSYTMLSFDPDTGKTVTVEARTPGRAYELAQAEYQRDTGPSQAVQ